MAPATVSATCSVLRRSLLVGLMAAWTAAFGMTTVGAQDSLTAARLPHELIESAREALAAGALDDAAGTLRQLRLSHPQSPLVVEALMLSAAVAAERDNSYQEQFLLTEARDAVQRLTGQGVLAAAEARDYRLQTARRLAVLLEQGRDYAGALQHYEEAIGLLAGRGGAQELAHLRLAAARLAYHYGVGIAGDAARYFDQVAVDQLGGAALSGYRELARGLMWDHLTPRQLGLGDANISAIATDGDDVWVGSWMGGLTRYARSTGRRNVFRDGPDSLVSRRVRDIAPIGGYVWVGTDLGMSVYALSSSRWRHEPALGDGLEPAGVTAIAGAAGDEVFAGTLGQGLWRRDATGWSAVGDGVLPGLFVGALRMVGETLWIGTIDLGLVALDLRSGALRSFDEINLALGPQNVTAIVPDGSGTLWIATFGSGLFRWEPGPNRVTHFSVAGGQLPDDWVLAGAAGDAGLYFGTFGGGAVRYSPHTDAWTTIGLAQGLPSLDVAVVESARGHIYFGTLGGGVAILSEARAAYGL